MAESEIKAKWTADTKDFNKEVLTTNQVLKENEQRLQASSKATDKFSQKSAKGASITGDLKGALKSTVLSYVGIEAAVSAVNSVLDIQTQALAASADATIRAAQAADLLTGVQGTLSGAIGASNTRNQGALLNNDAALRRQAQIDTLTQFDVQIAGSDSAVEKIVLSTLKFFERGFQAFGVGHTADALDALKTNQRVLESGVEEQRKTNETRRTTRDTD